MRLIDADEFEAILLKNASPTFDAGVLYALNTLDKAPTVDAVPVVRCKNCIHYDEWADGGKTYSGCALDDWNHRSQDDYCSLAERKSDNE